MTAAFTFHPGAEVELRVERCDVAAGARTPYYRDMATEVENLVLEHLRAIRGDLTTVKEDVRNIKVRLTSLEENTAAMNRRLDKMDERIERIEKRLDLVDA